MGEFVFAPLKAKSTTCLLAKNPTCSGDVGLRSPPRMGQMVSTIARHLKQRGTDGPLSCPWRGISAEAGGLFYRTHARLRAKKFAVF